MPLNFVLSQKGNQQLVHKGFVNTTDKLKNDKLIWKCVHYNKRRCLGRVWTADDNVIYENDKHNHVPDVAEIRVKEVMASFKQKAQTLMDTPQQILASVTLGLPAAVAGILPPVAGIKRNILKARQKATGAMSCPTNMCDLLIPDKYTYTVAGDKFLQFDSGASDNRIINFSTQKNLDLMATCDHWYADGTFKTSPPLFEQVFTIHVIKYNNVLPTVYALLPDKCQDTYSRVLDQLKLLKPGLSPISVMTDFENAQINAFSHNFPNIKNRGCFFHFSQCIWRKIQTIPGIRSNYADKDDPDFALNVRKLGALALIVPEPDVVECFERFLQTKFYTDNEDLLSDLVDYFESTWIGKPRRTGLGRMLPKYKLGLWNCYETTLDDLPKTNNAVEGWHRGFSSLLGANHPSIWKFIEGLQNQQSLNEFQINQYISGLTPALGRRCYRDTALRIKEIVEDYGGRDTSDYLQGIAHNFQFQY